MKMKMKLERNRHIQTVIQHSTQPYLLCINTLLFNLVMLTAVQYSYNLLCVTRIPNVPSLQHNQRRWEKLSSN